MSVSPIFWIQSHIHSLTRVHFTVVLLPWMKRSCTFSHWEKPRQYIPLSSIHFHLDLNRGDWSLISHGVLLTRSNFSKARGVSLHSQVLFLLAQYGNERAWRQQGTTSQGGNSHIWMDLKTFPLAPTELCKVVIMRYNIALHYSGYLFIKQKMSKERSVIVWPSSTVATAELYRNLPCVALICKCHFGCGFFFFLSSVNQCNIFIMWNKECVSASVSARSGFAGAKSTIQGHRRGQIQGSLVCAAYWKIWSICYPPGITRASAVWHISRSCYTACEHSDITDWLACAVPSPDIFIHWHPGSTWFCRSIEPATEHNLAIYLVTEGQLVKTSETHRGKMLCEEKMTWLYLVHHSDKLWLKYTCQRLNWVKICSFFQGILFLLIKDSSTSLTKVHTALLKIKTTVVAGGLNV